MHKPPQISVIIPAFNRANTIGYCLESVFAQTFSPLEIIVVDDCSTDKTRAVLTHCHDPRVRLISLQRNSGAQVARNCGIKAARGEWIAFQDSDDEWLPDKLARQVQVLAGVAYNRWTVVHSDAIWFDDSAAKQLPMTTPLVNGDNVYPILLQSPGPLFPSMLVSRAALERIGYLDEQVRSYQEWDTAIRLAEHCRFIHIRDALFIYHLQGGRSISKDRRGDIAGYNYIINKFVQEIRLVGGEAAWQRHMISQLVRCLDYGFWEEADHYLRVITMKSWQMLLLRWCRMLHLAPRHLMKLKNSLNASYKGDT